jgi:glycosyltransferase involved in cell wall biosynthesis
MSQSNPSPTTADARADVPAVSVVIPAYNVAPFIRETIDSILAQSFRDYEIILVNDGSPDTTELEHALEPYREHVRYLKQENSGAAAARNAGLKVARGTYVAFLDADDYWMENYLEEQMAFIRQADRYDLVYADALLFGDSSELAGRTYMEIAPSHGEVTFEKLVRDECNIITSGVVARRRVLHDVGLFDESLRRAQDYDLWLRLAKAGARLGYQRKVLLRYRIHSDSLSGDAIRQIERHLTVLNKTARRDDLTPSEKTAVEGAIAHLEAHLKLERGKLRLADGDFAAAAIEIKDANRWQRSWRLRLVLLWLRIAPRSLQRVYKLRMI